MIAVAARSLAPATAALAAAGIGLLYAGVAGALLDLWLAGSYYSYVVLVPLFSGWLAWEGRHRLAGAAAWWWPGLAVVAAGIALLTAGDAAGSLTVQALSLPVTLAGIALVALGPTRFGAVAFPIAFLVFLTPLPEGAIPRLSLPLQRLAAEGAAASLTLLGIPFARDGLFLHLQPVTLHISEACNGLRFLLAMVVLSVAFAGAVLAGTGPRLVLLASGVVLALAANQVRVTGTAVLAHAWGPDAATGLVHIAWGKVVYAATLVPFGALALRLRATRAGPDARPRAPSAGDGDAPDGGPGTVSVAIPTRGRPGHLAEAVAALLAQTRPMDELIVVDQSADDDGRRCVTALVAAKPAARRPRLVYVRDPAIPGAAAARNAALELFRGDVLVFCDDDVVAAPDVLETLCAHYRRAPWLAGVAPVIVNYEPPPWTLRLFLRVFLRGPFRDERQPIYWFWRRHPPGALLPVRMFTGAMMSFRRSALAGVRMDPRFRGASTGEDVDLCWQLVSRGARLAIATDARIVHHRAPRPRLRPEATLVTSWAYLYDRHVPKTLPARAAFAWYVVGVALNALQGAVRARSLEPLRSVAAGLRSVASDYDGCPFLAPPPPRRRR